jgi:hypothetical protein
LLFQLLVVRLILQNRKEYEGCSGMFNFNLSIHRYYQHLI